jgi:hypothetical protein
MFRLNAVFLFCTVFASALSSAVSVNASVDSPAIYSIEFDGMANAMSSSGTSPQSGNYFFFGGTLDVDASAAAVARPAVSAGIGSGGCTSGFGGSGCAGYNAAARLTYSIYVNGPTGVQVPYYFKTAGNVTIDLPPKKWTGLGCF